MMHVIVRSVLCLSIGTVCSFAHPQFPNERHVYLRGEIALLRIRVPGAEGRVVADTSGWFPETLTPRGGEVAYKLNTALLRAGEYEVRARMLPTGSTPEDIAIFPLTIAAERNPQRFPLWNWQNAYSSDLSWWTARGFNGLSGELLADEGRVAQMLDDGARLGLDMGLHLSPLSAPNWKNQMSLHALLPNGQRDPESVYPREPEVLESARQMAEATARRYADYPAFRHALLQSEYQTPLCVNESAVALAQKEAGLDLKDLLRPEWTVAKEMRINALALPAALQQKDGVIADDNPIYRILKWWWERGHGTSVMNAEMSRILKAGNPEFLTWHDPYRLAPVYYSHTGLDAISTWTYGHPDILHLLYTTVMQAAAKRERQKVMQTITLWVYGRFVIPMGKGAPSIPDLIPDPYQGLPFFVEGADFTREAMWLVMSQRPDILSVFHPYRLSPDNTKLDPYLTSPESFDAIGEVSRTLVEPYGPAILQCRRFTPRVAVLMSAAAMWFPATDSDAGWTNQSILPFCTLLARCHTPFDVLLDDDILEGRLDNYDVLVIGRGDTLLRSEFDRIRAFAASGRKVIADNTLRAKIPGAVATDIDFGFERDTDGYALAAGHAITADEYGARMESYAKRLDPLLKGVARPAESDSRRVIINGLESGRIRYIFLVNDDKTYGPRFGQWKLVQEVGVRQTANFRIPIDGAPALYDAISRAPIKYVPHEGSAEFSLSLAPARGRLIAVLPESIGKIAVTMPETCRRGEACSVGVQVLGASGRPLEGTVPLRLEVVDAAGRATEYRRSVATTEDLQRPGSYRYTMAIRPGLNDIAGAWQIRVTELLGGAEARQSLLVE
jgi:hypothetical protein